MKYRIWHKCQIGMDKKFYYSVKSVDEAWFLLNVIWDYDSFQYRNKIKGDYTSASGLQYFNENDNEWEEWYDENGCDIEEHFYGIRKEYL